MLENDRIVGADLDRPARSILRLRLGMTLSYVANPKSTPSSGARGVKCLAVRSQNFYYNEAATRRSSSLGSDACAASVESAIQRWRPKADATLVSD